MCVYFVFEWVNGSSVILINLCIWLWQSALYLFCVRLYFMAMFIWNERKNKQWNGNFPFVFSFLIFVLPFLLLSSLPELSFSPSFPFLSLRFVSLMLCISLFSTETYRARKWPKCFQNYSTSKSEPSRVNIFPIATTQTAPKTTWENRFLQCTDAHKLNK